MSERVAPGAARTAELEPRIGELDDELAAAQRTIDVLIARLERSGTASPTQAEPCTSRPITWASS